MPNKTYEVEFDPNILETLKEREILGKANVLQLFPLLYNLELITEGIERQFQEERKSNPLLTTTAPESWLAIRIAPLVREIRPNVEVDEVVLNAALQKFFKARKPAQSPSELSGGEEACTTVWPYIPALQNLLEDLFNPRKSLRWILSLERDARGIRKGLMLRKPGSIREAIIIQGIEEGWGNQRIATELDKRGLKPKSRNYGSYIIMLKMRPQLFYSLKNGIKKKYLSTVAKRHTSS